MQIFQHIKDTLLSALEELAENEQWTLDLHDLQQKMVIEPTKDPRHGDMATNLAMLLTKPLQRSPKVIAEGIIKALAGYDIFTKIEIAGPGFINVTLSDSTWQNIVASILKKGTDFGCVDVGKGKRINFEYVSTNPTGPLHIGHARGAAFGDSLARLLRKANFDVTTEYYINDAGNQIDTLTQSLFLRYQEQLGETITIPEGLYPGEYLIPVAVYLKETYGDTLHSMPQAKRDHILRSVALEKMMDLIRNDLNELGVEHDIFTSEQSIHDSGKIEKGLAIFEAKGLLYTGTLEAPKGDRQEDEHWEAREQLLFKSTDYGDDLDRALKKSDGGWTYFAADVGYQLDKLDRGFDTLLLGLGTDHSGYSKRMEALVHALSDGKATLEIKFHAIVHFLENGVPIKMSKRAGKFTTLQDVLNAVGKDAIRFMMMTRKNDQVLDFDLVKAKDESNDNPLFYVQYAHARASSVFRNAQQDFPEGYAQFMATPTPTLGQLKSPEELNLMKTLALWPRIVEQAAIHHEPHRIAYYLKEVAGSFHSLWNHGKEKPHLRFIVKDDIHLTIERLALVKATMLVLRSALALFNITPVDEL